MDISRLTSTQETAQATSRNKAQADVDRVSRAFQKADKRIQQQRDSTSVELSALGKIGSSLSDAQIASRALSDSKQTATDVGTRKAAAGFVKTFSIASLAARSATAAKGILADNTRVRAEESGLRRLFSSDTAEAQNLKKIGISQKNDGTLSIDQKQFDDALKSDPNAVRTTLSAAGQKADQFITRELSASGNIGSAIGSLDNRARNLEARQVEQQAQSAAAQQTISVQSTRLGDSLNTGIAAYQRIFSL